VLGWWCRTRKESELQSISRPQKAVSWSREGLAPGPVISFPKVFGGHGAAFCGFEVVL